MSLTRHEFILRRKFLVCSLGLAGCVSTTSTSTLNEEGRAKEVRRRSSQKV